MRDASSRPARLVLGCHPMSDPLDGWGNSALDVRSHVEVPTPRGVVTVDRVPGDTDSQTRWSARVATARQMTLRRRANVAGRLLRSSEWADLGDFSYRGDRELAQRLADDARVGAVLRGWRSFELQVLPTQVLLKVPTGNVDQDEARQGVTVITAVLELLGP